MNQLVYNSADEIEAPMITFPTLEQIALEQIINLLDSADIPQLGQQPDYIIPIVSRVAYAIGRMQSLERTKNFEALRVDRWLALMFDEE